MQYTFSGTTVLLGLVGACLLTAVSVYLLRLYLSHRGRSTTTMGKSPDIFSLAPVVHRYALSASIFAVFLSLNWTEYSPDPVYAPVFAIDGEIDKDIPITYRKPPPPPAPPPPPPPVIEAVPDDQASTVDHVDQSITEEDGFVPEEPPVFRATKVTPPPPPMPPPPKEDPNIIRIMADHMPVFGKTCLDLSGDERKSCSDRELMQFIAGQIRYPATARENGIEGTVYVRFVVEKDGTVSAVEALRKVPGGCTEEALRAVQQINEKTEGFRPGLQAGQPVRVMFNMPIKFQLDR
ncbi:MAG: energy transducer TonB [Lewinella sp.]